MQNQSPHKPQRVRDAVKQLVWDASDKRLRAGWRILIHLFVTMILMGLIALVWSLFVYVIATPLQVDASIWGALNRAGISLASLGVIAGLALAGRFLDHRAFKSFGFVLDRRWWRDLGFGLVLGGALMALIFGVQYALGWVEITGVLQSRTPFFAVDLVLYVGYFIAVGIQEEVIIRGYWLRNLAEGLNSRRVGPGAALLISYGLSSALFGVLHLGNPNASLVSTVNLILAGLLLGLPYVLTGELAIPIGLHITWNFFQGNVFGFPVSGMTPDTVSIAIRQGGPEIWTGGAFGPEAGLIGVLAMLAGAGLIVMWLKIARKQLVWRKDLAVYAPPT